MGIGDVNNDCSPDFLITGATLNTAYIIAGLPGICPGDANGDLIVNLADIVVVILHWAGLGGMGDLNCDGRINLADIAIVLANWNDHCSTTR